MYQIKFNKNKSKWETNNFTNALNITLYATPHASLSKIYKPDFEQIIIPREISPIHEVFFIPNLTTVLLKEGESIEEYINNFQEGTSNKPMHIFTYGSAQGSYLYGN